MKAILHTALFSFLFQFSAYTQNQERDSLIRLADGSAPDTVKIIAMNKLVNHYISSAPEKSMDFAKRALQLSEQVKWKHGLATSYNSIGYCYFHQSDFSNALGNWVKALEIRQQLQDKKGIAKSYGNIGLVYWSQANYPTALDYYFRALKMAEETGDKKGMAHHIGNIGIVYFEEAKASRIDTERNELFGKALDYYKQALKIKEETGDKNAISSSLGNIGLVYYEQAITTANAKQREQLFGSSLDYTFKALKLSEAAEDNSGIERHLGNIANTYNAQLNFTDENSKKELTRNATKYYEQALEMARLIGDKKGEVRHLCNIGALSIKLGSYEKAEAFIKNALLLGDSIGVLDYTRDIEKLYSELDSAKGNFSGAYAHYKKYVLFKEMIASEENTKRQTRTEMQFEFDKKEAQTRADQEKKDAVMKIIVYSISGGLLLVLLLALFIFRSYRQKHKANKLILKQKAEVEQQKTIIEEKQKEILDSIYYARRIQRALITNEKYIEKKLYLLNR